MKPLPPPPGQLTPALPVAGAGQTGGPTPAGVRRADVTVRWLARLSLLVLLAFVGLLVGNALHYARSKGPAQLDRAAHAVVALGPLPEEAAAWLPRADASADPWPAYQRVLLDYRAGELEFLVAKLRDDPQESDWPGGALLDSLHRAAQTPAKALPLAQERRLRGADLADAASLMRLKAQALAAKGDERSDAEAEDWLRCWYSVGYFMATRRQGLETVRTGVGVMLDAAKELAEFLQQRQRIEETIAIDRLQNALGPWRARLDALAAYTDDDEDLEVWVLMLRDGDRPAIRLHGAVELARAAGRWWRYSESSRAINALRAGLAGENDTDVRAALFELLDAAERARELPTPWQPGQGNPTIGEVRQWWDSLF